MGRVQMNIHEDIIDQCGVLSRASFDTFDFTENIIALTKFT